MFRHRFRDLVDRQAKALAKQMYDPVCKKLVGYAADKSFSNNVLIDESCRYLGPSPRHPTCTATTVSGPLFKSLQARKNAVVTLTANCAQWPRTTVLVFHSTDPDTRYFAVGMIGRDQLVGYVQRKARHIKRFELWKTPNL
jgi:5-methyltetrahydrofolate--homocysteine methyltransferase